MDTDADNKQEATRALITFIALEGFALGGVLAVYFITSDVTYLIGGAIGVFVIFGLLFFRLYKEHGPALKASAGPRG
jgi:FtsH-binding integral membrane protein